MLHRNADGSYTASSPDGEHVKEMTKEEGEAMILRIVPEPYLTAILSETGEGFVIT